jgi:hypothetical protein
MDFVEGEDLQDMLERRGSLPETEVLPWIAAVCDALAYLHSQSPPIIHRDLKPANIKITPEGKAVLVDFGIAKVFDTQLRTTIGARAITPGFSPPEQYGFGRTGPASDIYALGATLYTLLTGETPPESVQRIAGIPLTQPRQLNRRITPQTEGLLLRALELDTQRRFGDVGELRASLTQAHTSKQPVNGRTFSILPMTIAVAAVALLTASGVGAWLIFRPQTTAPTRTAIPAITSSPTTAAIATMKSKPSPTVTLTTKASTPSPPDPTSAAAATNMAPKTTATAEAPATSTPRPTATESCPAVTGPFAAIWASNQAKLGCAQTGAFTGLMAEETFEGGKMFWREPIDDAQALVLFNNGTWRIFSHTPYVEGSPEFPCADADTPAQCPPTPKRGFGAMWCDIPEIRNGLGNALDCERGYEGTLQQFERGFALQSDTGTMFVGFSDGTWIRR